MAWFSITKLFTATAVMQLADAGRLGLDEPVSRYLPRLRVAKNGRDATVRHLLSHLAGLRNPRPVSWIHLADEPGPGLDALVSRVIGSSPELGSRPGDRFSYSNLGYLLLGQIIERVSGERYEDYIQRRVLQPLGCDATGFAVPADEATGHQRRLSFMGLAARWMLDSKFFEESVDGYWPLRRFTVDGAPYGGLIGPIGDLLAFAKMVLRDGMGERARVLEEHSVQEMLHEVKNTRGRELPIGLGWHLGQEDGRVIVYHLGGGGGYRSELRIHLALGYAVAVLATETSFPTRAFTRLIVARRQDDSRCR
jgi:CubicO group peptidase (beta-lactamase class C family)